jgi:hypothetical protein
LKEKVPAKLLFKVHADKQVAIETCLLFVSQFTKTIIDYLRGDEYHISMWSKILIENYGKNYKRIIDVLIYGGILVWNHASADISFFHTIHLYSSHNFHQ